MSPSSEEINEPADRLSDRALWQRCRNTDAPEDDPLQLLDLAAYAEGNVDSDDFERIGAFVGADLDVSADVAAARGSAEAVTEDPAIIARIIARASALHPTVVQTHVLPLRRPRRHILLHGLAQWGSLAAALAIAAWLGFTMGSDASLALSPPVMSGEDVTVSEPFDPATGFLHDLPAGVQT